MQNLGVFYRIGDLWLRVLKELEENGAETIYTDNVGEQYEVKELLGLTAEIQNAILGISKSGGYQNDFCRKIEVHS